MIRHPEEQRIGERRVDIATSHRREQLRKDNRYKDRRSRSEQVPDKPARQDEEGASSRITPVPVSPAGPSAVEEVAELRMNISVHRWQSIPHSFDRMLKRHAEELDRLWKLAPLCDKCSSGHGTRSGCPYCAMKKLCAALSQIDYAAEEPNAGEPNDMQVSGFDVHCNEDAVVVHVKATLDRLRTSLSGYQSSIRWSINRLSKALHIAPDIVKAMEYYAEQAAQNIERLEKYLTRSQSAEADVAMTLLRAQAAEQRLSKADGLLLRAQEWIPRTQPIDADIERFLNDH